MFNIDEITTLLKQMVQDGKDISDEEIEVVKKQLPNMMSETSIIAIKQINKIKSNLDVNTLEGYSNYKQIENIKNLSDEEIVKTLEGLDEVHNIIKIAKTECSTEYVSIVIDSIMQLVLDIIEHIEEYNSIYYTKVKEKILEIKG